MFAVLMHEMGITERREREKTELRDKILAEAREILIKEGQDNLSIRNIAAAVEYSPATIYLYFKDKDEIVYELMEMGFGLMHEQLLDSFQEEDPVMRVQKIGLGYVSFGLENPEWYHIMFNSSKPIQHLERCQEEWGAGIRLFDFLVNTCDEVIRLGRADAEDAKLLAVQLWSVVHGLVTLYHSQRLEMVEKDAGKHLVHKTIESMIRSIFN